MRIFLAERAFVRTNASTLTAAIGAETWSELETPPYGKMPSILARAKDVGCALMTRNDRRGGRRGLSYSFNHSIVCEVCNQQRRMYAYLLKLILLLRLLPRRPDVEIMKFCRRPTSADATYYLYFMIRCQSRHWRTVAKLQV